MPSFRAVPLPQSEDEFLRGADAPAPTAPVPSAAPRADAAARASVASGPDIPPRDESDSWQDHDPRARPTINQTVRLNTYQHAQLVYIAEREERSLAQVLRRILGPALEQAIAQSRDD